MSLAVQILIITINQVVSYEAQTHMDTRHRYVKTDNNLRE